MPSFRNVNHFLLAGAALTTAVSSALPAPNPNAQDGDGDSTFSLGNIAVLNDGVNVVIPSNWHHSDGDSNDGSLSFGSWGTNAYNDQDGDLNTGSSDDDAISAAITTVAPTTPVVVATTPAVTLDTSAATTPSPIPVSSAAPAANLVSAAKNVVSDLLGGSSQSDDSDSTSSAPDSYAAQALNATNVFRAEHGAGTVEWDSRLAQAAADLANTCVWAHNTALEGGGYGQNLYGGSGSISDAITAWYDEVTNFAGFFGMAQPPTDSATFEGYGHFTQLVWKATTKIGCASSPCANQYGGMTVCNYYPPGNYEGEYAANVQS